MPAPPPLVHGAEEMSTLQKLKMGAITGSLVGMSIVSVRYPAIARSKETVHDRES